MHQGNEVSAYGSRQGKKSTCHLDYLRQVGDGPNNVNNAKQTTPGAPIQSNAATVVKPEYSTPLNTFIFIQEISALLPHIAGLQ